MREDPAASPPRSSVLYALGKLTAETTQHAQEVAKLTEAQESLPQKIVLALTPRFRAIENKQAADSKRIDGLERWRWLNSGGLAVLVTGIGWVILAYPALRPHLIP